MGCLAPGAAVTFMRAAAAIKPYAAERLLIEFDRQDFVFLSTDLPLLRGGGAPAGLRSHTKVMLVPTITFAAFHPDQIYVGPDGRAPISGPMGQSHSALVLFGYLSGLSQGEALRLFQRRVFERVGYFDAWEASVEGLRKLGAEADYDIKASLAHWMRRGCFMHSANHIKLFVAIDLARGLLSRAKVAQQQCNLEDYLSADPGRGESWPVYPEIAAHYGVPGSALFLRPASGRRTSRSTMSLSRFVEESFAAYARVPQSSLHCQRVAEWQADADLRADLRSIAKDA